MRFPNDRVAANRGEAPTLRAESPRQTQYAYSNIDLVARDARNVRPFNPKGFHDPVQLHGIFNADSWNGEGAVNAPMGLNPLINNNISINGFDTEMSDAQGNSSGLTPQSNYSYNHSSSNTSYSPPNVQDEDPATTIAPNMPSMDSTIDGYATRYGAPGSHLFDSTSDNLRAPSPALNNSSPRTYANHKAPGDHIFNPASNKSNSASPSMNNNHNITTNSQAFTNNNAQAMNGVAQDDMFKNMQNWDMGGSPGPLPGMTPGGEWEKMMDSMGQSMGWGMTPGGERNG